MKYALAAATLQLTNKIKKLEKVAFSDALPHKASRRDSIAKLKFFWALLLSFRQTQCHFI